MPELLRGCRRQLHHVSAAAVPGHVPPGHGFWNGAGGLLASMSLEGSWQDQYAPQVQLRAPTLVRSAATITIPRVDSGAQDIQRHCRLDAGRFVGCSGTWSLTGLPSGTHTVTVFATDATGRMSSWERATIAADSIAPRTTLRLPTTAEPYVVLSPTLQMFFSVSSGPAGIRYMQGRRRTATPTTGYTAFSIPSSASKILSNGIFPTPVAGREDCWQARGVDVLSQVGAWSPERCYITPLDDTRLSGHGFVRLSSSAAYRFTRSYARRTGATLSLRNVHARRVGVGVVVATCSACGSFDVYVGSRRLGRVNTYASRTHSKVVLWLPHQAVERRGTLVLKTTSSRRVFVDGIVVRHR